MTINVKLTYTSKDGKPIGETFRKRTDYFSPEEIILLEKNLNDALDSKNLITSTEIFSKDKLSITSTYIFDSLESFANFTTVPTKLIPDYFFRRQSYLTKENIDLTISQVEI